MSEAVHCSETEKNSQVTHEEYLCDYAAIQKAVQEEIAANKHLVEKPTVDEQLEEITF